MHWWLSFHGETGNLGCAIVEAESSVWAAALRASELGIHPGGEAQGYPLHPGAPASKADIERWGVDRLISPDELRKAGAYVDPTTGAELRLMRFHDQRERSKGAILSFRS